MNEQTRLVVASLASSLLAAIFLSGLIHFYPAVPPRLLDLPNKKCEQDLKFRPGYMREINGLESLRDRGWSFQGVSYLEAYPCKPGLLKLRAKGEPARGQAPELQIALNFVPLTTLKFDVEKEYVVVVPESGHLTLAYFNDYFEADVREAVISRVTALNCSQRPNLRVLGPSGGIADTALGLATLYSNVKIRIEICSEGKIQLRLFGREGKKELPIVRFLKGSVEVARFQTKHQEEKITFSTTGTLDMELLNPYSVLVEDRNLYLEDVTYSQ